MDALIVSNTVITKMLNELDIVQLEPDLVVRFEKLDDVARVSGQLTEGLKLVRAASLALIKRVWDDLPFETRKHYGYQFQIYAQSRIPNAQWKTISNHIRAAETFILDRFEVQQTITLTDGSRVEFDPLDVPISKLVVARSSVEDGDLTDELWNKLADNECSVDMFKQSLITTNPKPGNYGLRYSLVGTTLLVEQYEQTAEVINAEQGFNWEVFYDDQHEDHKLVYDAIMRILRMLNVNTKDL